MSRSRGSKFDKASGKNHDDDVRSEDNERAAKSADAVDAQSEPFLNSPAVGVDNSFSVPRDSFESGPDAREFGMNADDGEASSMPDEPLSFPDPEVFNSYPVEVQRKIMEWTDRDIKARRDDESRRRDELMRAEVARERMKQVVPAVVIILAIACAAVTGVITANPLFSAAFLVIPLTVIIGGFVLDKRSSSKVSNNRNHRRM